MRRGLSLYGIWLLAWYHRLRHDLGRELTVVAASGVMFGTFLYVFNDFLNVQIASIAVAMRAAFAQTLTIASLVLAGGVTVYWILRHDPKSVATMAAYLGEDPRILATYHWLRATTIIIFWHGAAWWLSGTYLARWSLARAAAVELALLLVSSVIILAFAQQRKGRSRGEHNQIANSLRALSLGSLTPRDILTRWRLTQIVFRSRLCRLLMVLSVPFTGLVMLSAVNAAPLFVACVSALASGYLLAATMNVQMAADLRHAWLERGLGVSHDDFMRAYQRSATYIASMIGGVTLIVYLLGQNCSGQIMPWSLTMVAASRVAVVAAVPALITPSLLLQVDGRRLSVTLPLSLIVCLFVGTAVIAHWLGLALVPLLISTARGSQAGRFYRA
ncbi:MAG: hypothetical protein FJ146_12375 [Deltaproteobacteria bacterium]|nr:hypothetical protein [Deltaproteobacteria bacterium]